MNPMRVTDWWIIESQQKKEYKETLELYDLKLDMMVGFETVKSCADCLEVNVQSVKKLRSGKLHSLCNGRYYKNEASCKKQDNIKIMDIETKKIFLFKDTRELADSLNVKFNSAYNLVTGKTKILADKYILLS